ncbi:MAG TPA: PAS domain-containing sensor histidine kinase, partial [Gemmatimonadaceae bacterium]|nr:PAS domain-containing sensor histidine kinase [Gemmatimonadaceae bacterium]
MRDGDRPMPHRPAWLRPLRVEAAPQPLSPHERSALRRRWRPLIPLGIALVSLLSLLLVLLNVERRARAALERISSVTDPARAAVTEVELALAMEIAGTRGFLLTGDEEFATSHRQGRAARQRAQARLAPLARQLGAPVLQATLRLEQRAAQADAAFDSLYRGELSKARFLEGIQDRQLHFASVISDAGALDAAIQQSAARQQQRFGASQRQSAVLSSVLALLALIALALLARLGAGFQRRALRLDARDRHQSALGETARRLNACTSVEDAARIIAEEAMDATEAIGARVELPRDTARDAPLSVETATTKGLSPPATVGYGESLTRDMAASGNVAIAADVEPLLERMTDLVPRRGGDGGELQGIVVPVLSDHHVRGTLAVVRPRTGVESAQAVASYLDALTELGASMLRRFELDSALRTSEQRYRQIADNIPSIIWLRDPVLHRTLYANAAFEEIWGRSRDSLYKNPWSWLDGVHPDDRERVLAVITGARTAEYHVEHRIVQPSGDIRWVSTRGFPVHDEHGGIYIAGVTEDITERKRYELGRQRLVRGFTHDVKNPLGAADGFLDLLQEGVFGELADKQRDSIARARSAIQRALELIGRALDLAKAEAGELELHNVELDVRDVIKETALDYRVQAEAKGQTLTRHVAPDVPTIISDPLRIRQIVGNLLSNAIRYTPPGGRLQVRVERPEASLRPP